MIAFQNLIGKSKEAFSERKNSLTFFLTILRVFRIFGLNNEGFPHKPKPQDIIMNETATAPRKLRERIHALEEIQSDIKTLSEMAKVIVDEIKNFAELNGTPKKVVIVDGNGEILCTASTEEIATLDRNALKKEEPDVYSNYTRYSTRQVVRLA